MPATKIRRSAALSAVTGTLIMTLALSGCASRGGTTTVNREPEPVEQSLTALERGELRREALRFAREGWAAFEADDPVAMRELFAENIADSYDKLRARYASEGRERHREFEILYSDVLELSSTGDKATVKIDVIDNSYFIEPDGTRTQPDGAERGIEIRLERAADGEYRIAQMISASKVLD